MMCRAEANEKGMIRYKTKSSRRDFFQCHVGDIARRDIKVRDGLLPR